MELDFALLSLFADKSDAGQVHVFGGGFNTLVTTVFPTPSSTVTLIVRFSVNQDELNNSHRLDLAMSRPDGEEKMILENQQLPFIPNRVDPSGQSWASFIATIAASYSMEGKYQIKVFGDGVHMKTIPLYVLTESAAKAAQEQAD